MTTNPPAPPVAAPGRASAPCSTPPTSATSRARSARSASTRRRHRGLRSRALALLAIIGPGLIVMVGDNDAGGVATYSQAGQNYGTSLLWVLLLLVPVLIVNQEMVVRLGAVTGVGHARLINERFGRFWGWFSVGDLFLLNFLTIVTEFIGVSLALGYFGVSKYIAVPIAAVGADRDHRQRQLPLLGALDVRVRVRELARDPAVLHGPPERLGPIVHALRRARDPGRRELDLGAADHRDRRHDRRAVAAVLPAVEHHRQADHPALDQLRAARHLDRRGRRRDRRGRADLRVGVRVRAARRTSATSPTPARPPPGSTHVLGSTAGRVLRDRPAERLADRRRRADAVDQLRVRRHVRHQELAAPQLPRRQGASTRCSPC